jgi:hypothetical protein
MTSPLMLVIALIALPHAADARTLYVNPVTGNDATTYAENSTEKPWATLGRAAWGSAKRESPNRSEAAQAGDMVIVAAGTYSGPGTDRNSEILFNPVNSGTREAPITFQAQGQVVVTLTSSRGPIIGAYGRDYIAWKGFTVRELDHRPDMGPVVLVQTTGSVIEDSTIVSSGMSRFGDNHPGVTVRNTRQVTVRNNKISGFHTRSARDPQCTPPTCFGVNLANGSGIQTYASDGFVFEHNDISDSGSGIHIKGGPWGGPPQRRITEAGIIRFNRITNTRTGIAVNAGWPGTASAPLLIYQNIISNSTEIGYRLWPFDGSVNNDPQHVKFVNNIIDGAPQCVYVSGTLIASASHTFWNNIVGNCGNHTLYFEGDDANASKDRIDFRHNAYFGFRRFAQVGGGDQDLSGWQRGFSQDVAKPGSQSTNPGYVNAAGGDFRAKGNTLREAGVDYLDLDRDGSTTDAVPLGPFVIGNETIGVITGDKTK